MATSMQMIYSFFKDRPGRWFTAGDVMKGLDLSVVTRNSIYNTLSVFSLHEPKYLRRQKSNSGVSEYSFNEAAPNFLSRAYRPKPKPKAKHVSNNQDKRVFWTPEEKSLMAVEAVALKKRYPNYPMSTIVELMQNVLPVDRRRKIVKTVNQVLWLDQLMKEAEKKTVANSEPKQSIVTSKDQVNSQYPEKTEPEKVTAPSTTTKPKPKENIFDQIARLDKANPSQKPQDDPHDLSSVSIDNLVNAIGAKFAETIKSALISAIKSALASDEVLQSLQLKAKIEVPPDNQFTKLIGGSINDASSAVSSKKNRPKVTIFGLRKDHQVREIERDFGNYIDLEFGQLEDAMGSIKSLSLAHRATEIFAVVDHVNYRHANSLRDAGIKFTRVDGIGQLRYQLSEGYKKYKYL